MGEQDICPHLDSIGEVTKEELLQKSKGTCQSCTAGGPNLWACLQNDCSYVGCGESYSDHSTLHAQAKKHNLTVNLTTFRVWCYLCEREVFLEQSQRPALSPMATSPTSPTSPHHHRCKAMQQEAAPKPPSPPFKSVPIAVAEDDGSESDEDELKPRGLTGMKNIGNSCYMNAALQALSNCPPLTQFFLDCSGLVRTDKKPALCKSYQKLISELWHKKRPSYVVPTGLSHSIKLVNPMFRGYAQQDTQEFLRCLMDQLHEELKEPLAECGAAWDWGGDGDERRDGDRSPSEDEFLSCDSGSSSDRGEGGGPGETELLLQDEQRGGARARAPAGGGTLGLGPRGLISEKERLKERLKARRVSGSPLRGGGSQEMDEDADVDTAAEEGPPDTGGGEEDVTSASNPPGQGPNQTQTPEQGPNQTQTPEQGQNQTQTPEQNQTQTPEQGHNQTQTEPPEQGHNQTQTQTPEQGLNQTQTPEQGLNQTQTPGKGLNQTQAPEQGLNQTQAPEQGLNQTQAPEQGLNQTQAPEQGLNQTQAPGKGLNQTQAPRKGLNQTQTPGKGLNQTQAPGKGLNQTQAPGQGLNQTQAPGKGLNQTQAPRKGLNQTPGQGQGQSSNTSEPDNEASMAQPHSRPCSPVRTFRELHPKLSSSPPRSSPLRSVGSAYAFKKAQLLLSSRKKKQSRYRSVISDIFDGSILSLVQCLTCDRRVIDGFLCNVMAEMCAQPGGREFRWTLNKQISTTVETFQDLSLPIPGKEDLAKLHASIHQNLPAKTGVCPDTYGSQGWVTFIMDSIRRFVVSCIPSWFWGPMVTLEDCLAAFFAADELKGDNMYSCERCKKLRNGIKYCKVLRLPEILCIHLKRFRHEVMYSFKINSHVSFPLEGLDLRPFLAKESPSQITTYDLLSVICHHGTAGSGHYIAYCQNVINGQWYEFDDQYVTEVHETVVQSAEAYVLFYRKSSEESVRERQKVVALASMREPSLLHFYISREWLNKFNTFTEPGAISNHTFLCRHGGIPPNKYQYIDDLVVILPQNVWEYLYNSFGGGPAVNHLYMCAICQVEIEALAKRRKIEIDTFIKLNKEFQAEEAPTVILCISMQWFREWESFVKGKDNEPPCPIDNSKIAVMKGGHIQLKQGADYGQISEGTWQYLLGIYSGGPEIAVRQTVAPADTDSLHGERKIEAETRAL